MDLCDGKLQPLRERGLDGRVVPIHADVHELPYADGFFDAIICIDSYSYYGAKPDFMDRYMAPLVKKGGFVAVAMPELQKDFPGVVVPEEMVPCWQEDMNFYSADWWKEL